MELSQYKRNAASVILAGALLSLACCLAGCVGSENAGRTAPSNQQNVAEVVQEQAATDAASSAPNQTTSDAGITQGQANQSTQDSAAEPAEEFVADTTAAFANVDFDLTTMGPEMVYATVYDMMVSPADYEGKIVRMNGPFTHTYYDATGKDYYYVVIQDATACCSQGLEFVWGDGSRAWPSEYPLEGCEVVVTGRFEPYKEGTVNYVHLTDASLEIA